MNQRLKAFALCAATAITITSCGSDSTAEPAAGTVSSATATQASTSADPRLPEGTYRTPELRLEQFVAAGVAGGFKRAAIEEFWREARVVPGRTVVETLKLQAGRWTAFISVDNGPTETIWVGTYEIVDDDTVMALESGFDCSVIYRYALSGGELRLAVQRHECDGEKAAEVHQIAQTTIYQTAPFTKLG